MILSGRPVNLVLGPLLRAIFKKTPRSYPLWRLTEIRHLVCFQKAMVLHNEFGNGTGNCVLKYLEGKAFISLQDVCPSRLKNV